MSEEADKIAQKIMKGDFGISFGQDPRFVSTMDQSRWCYTLFNDYLRCKAKVGEDAPRCQYLLLKSGVICPNKTIATYQESIENGTWWGYKPETEKN